MLLIVFCGGGEHHGRTLGCLAVDGGKGIRLGGGGAATVGRCADAHSEPDMAAELVHGGKEAESHVELAREIILIEAGGQIVNECVGALNWYGDPPDVKAKNRRNLEKRQAVTDKAVRRYDPTRLFWPSSPCAGPGDYSDAWHDDSKGDMHNWTVWHENKSFDNYYKYRPRFCSEFGYQSFPSREMALTFCAEEDLNPTAPDFEWHQKNPGGNRRILETMSRYFRFPEGAESILYLSQVQQAMAIRTAIEGWRRLRPLCMGTLFWQLNDIWPVASWASIDYDGRWKALQYAAKEFYAPHLLILTEEDGKVTVSVANETDKPLTATVKWQLLKNDLTVLDSGEYAVNAAAWSASDIGVCDFTALSDEQKRTCVVAASLYIDREWPACEQVVRFVKAKDFQYLPPHITASFSDDGHVLTLQADAFADGVWVEFGHADCRFSRNGFSLTGEPVPLVLSRVEGTPSIEDLTILCLNDTM